MPRLPLVLQPDQEDPLDAPQAPDPAWFVVTLPCFLKLFYLPTKNSKKFSESKLHGPHIISLYVQYLAGDRKHQCLKHPKA